jgi:hypothetical protein
MFLVSLKAQFRPLAGTGSLKRWTPLPDVGIAIAAAFGRVRLGSRIANMAIAFGHGITKRRVREEKDIHEKGDLQRTENSDPKRTEKCELENGHCQSSLVSLSNATIGSRFLISRGIDGPSRLMV